MRQFLFCIILCGILSTSLLTAQDFNFSNYNASPLIVNPANAGNFDGIFRANTIFSSSQSYITGKPYANVSLSVDARIKLGFRHQDRIGIGVQSDLISSAGLVSSNGFYPSTPNNWSFYRIGATYHYSIDEAQNHVLSLGLMYNHGSRKYLMVSKSDGRVSPNGTIDIDIENFNNQVKNGVLNTSNYKGNMTLGLLYKGKINKSTFTLGAAYEGIFNPYIVRKDDPNTFGVSEERLYGFNLHGAYAIHINNKWQITPGFFYYSLGKYSAININTQASYMIKSEKDLKIIGGLGVRNQKYMTVFTGVTYKGFQWQLNRDFSTASTIGSGFSGIEISMGYIRKIKDK